jgi:hypothetical protein
MFCFWMKSIQGDKQYANWKITQKYFSPTVGNLKAYQCYLDPNIQPQFLSTQIK